VNAPKPEHNLRSTSALKRKIQRKSETFFWIKHGDSIQHKYHKHA
jgi:hypothetical protein